MLLHGAAVRDASDNCTEIPATKIPHLSFLQVWQRWETEAVLLRSSGVHAASRDAVGCNFVECVNLPRATGLAAVETDAVLPSQVRSAGRIARLIRLHFMTLFHLPPTCRSGSGGRRRRCCRLVRECRKRRANGQVTNTSSANSLDWPAGVAALGDGGGAAPRLRRARCLARRGGHGGAAPHRGGRARGALCRLVRCVRFCCTRLCAE